MDRTNNGELPSHRGGDDHGRSRRWVVPATLVLGTLAIAGLRPSHSTPAELTASAQPSTDLAVASIRDTTTKEASSTVRRPLRNIKL